MLQSDYQPHQGGSTGQTRRSLSPARWHCAGCGSVIGQIYGEVVRITHRRRIIEARLPCQQVCDECGAFNAQSGREHGSDPLDTGRERA